MDVAGIVKINKEQYAQVDINGIYPAGPNQPFGGFGLRRSECGSAVSRDEQHVEPDGLPRAADHDCEEPDARLPVPRRAIHRQWQHLTGTWNPTDPARFIQPDAFPNNRLLWRTDGMQDQNSLATGNTLTNNPMWNPYSVRLAGDVACAGAISWCRAATRSWRAVQRPDHRSASGQQPAARAVRAGDRHLVDRRTAAEPARDAHPLLLPDARRGPGQGAGRPHAEPQGRPDLRIAAAGRNVELSANVFNLLNGGDYTEYARTGPNRIYNPASYLTYTNPQTPRALQLEAVVRF